jgi:hypothetical protein
MSLNELLEQMRQASWGRWSKDKLDIVLKARDSLARSGIVENMLKVGQKAPDFELASTRGGRVRLSELLRRGPLVIAYYRGHW